MQDAIVHHPFVLQLGPLPLTGFGIAMLGAFVIAQIVTQSELARRGHDPEIMPDIVIAAVIGGLLGGKIYYAILTGDAGSLGQRAGFVFWGGLIGGIVATFGWIKFKKLSFTQVSDVSAIGIAASRLHRRICQLRDGVSTAYRSWHVGPPQRQ